MICGVKGFGWVKRSKGVGKRREWLGTAVGTNFKTKGYKNGSINGPECCQTLHREELWSLEGQTLSSCVIFQVWSLGPEPFMGCREETAKPGRNPSRQEALWRSLSIKYVV